ncbi:MAG: FAD-dependent oxidoreductase [bacterium]|nr:FAD-dependent oxidoreductase [bacterium]
MAPQQKKNIVILGAGFGGVKTAFSLYKKLQALNLLDRYSITLVDKNAYHTYTPTLYEVATTAKTLANHIALQHIVTFPLENIFKGTAVYIRKASVAAINVMHGDVHLDNEHRMTFDYLVLALGAEVNFFNISGLQEHALTLKTFTDAIKVRDTIWQYVEDASSSPLHIVIGGGGATGVELASEIKSWQPKASVTLIEAHDELLKGFHKKVIQKVTKRLQKINVQSLLNARIQRVDDYTIHLEDTRTVPYTVFIWTGGIKATSIMGVMPLKKEHNGTVTAWGTMQCIPQTPNLKLAGKIYGIGDAICSLDQATGTPVPQLAEAAIEQAEITAHNIIEDIKVQEKISQKPSYDEYTPKVYSYVIPVGGKYAVAKVGSVIISGFFGWVLKGIIELCYLIFHVMPLPQALRVWLHGLKIFIKNDRLG